MNHTFLFMDENKHNNSFSLTTLFINKNKFYNLLQDISKWYLSIIKENAGLKTINDLGWIDFHFTYIKKLDLKDGIPFLNIFIKEFIKFLQKIEKYCYIRTYTVKGWSSKKYKNDIIMNANLCEGAMNPYNFKLLSDRCSIPLDKPSILTIYYDIPSSTKKFSKLLKDKNSEKWAKINIRPSTHMPVNPKFICDFIVGISELIREFDKDQKLEKRFWWLKPYIRNHIMWWTNIFEF